VHHLRRGAIAQPEHGDRRALWREGARSEKLPPWEPRAAYMPPAMAGPHGRATRVTALVLIAVFLGATVCGVCLTYGVIA